MRAVGVIPARWASTRFEGKVIAPIHGRPMIQHVWQRCKHSRFLEDIIIACDDERVLKTAQEFGAKAVMTSLSHASGTDRIAEAVRDINAEIIVNIQADEPLIHHNVIDDLVCAIRDDETVSMATVVKVMDTMAEVNNPNIVKAVIDRKGYALYFSRSVIPYNREKKGLDQIRYYKHLGIYAYRKDFLMAFSKMPRSRLEETEQLEQLRALEAGVRIKTVVTDKETIGVDTPEDLAKVEAILNGR